jgi:hypothetical protein
MTKPVVKLRVVPRRRRIPWWVWAIVVVVIVAVAAQLAG